MLVVGDNNGIGYMPVAMCLHIGQHPIWEFDDEQAW